MEVTGSAFEADADLQGPALQEHRQRRGDDYARHATAIAGGGVYVDPMDDQIRDGHEHRESSPLLRGRPNEVGRDDEDDGDADGQSSSPSPYDFSHLPWHRRPSIYWVLAPFFLVACAFGGIITPKMNLILELVCREYMAEQQLRDPNFVAIPVDFNDGENSQCRIAPVQSQVAMFNLWGNLIAGLLSAYMSPRLGALSDRYGRTKILVVTSIGTILGEIVTICAASYPETFPAYWLLLSYGLDGLTGSFLVAMAIANAYATDCTPPARRNVVFGYFHSCLFSGIALGPIVAGYIVKKTGRIVAIFYILTAIHALFALFIGIFVPESLSKERQMLAREIHRKAQKDPDYTSEWSPLRDLKNLHPINMLLPLKILYPTGPGTSATLRRNLGVLATVDTICFGVAMGSMGVIIIYTNYQFGWGSFESGRFLTIANSCRVFCLIVILPALTRLVRGKPSVTRDQKQKNTGADFFDLIIIRAAIFFDTLGFIGYIFSRSGTALTLSACVASIGGIGSPTLQSVLTKHVPAGKTGQLLGATGLLHALARVVAPTVFSAIYSATVGKFTQTVFVCLAATFGVAFVLSWFIRAHVFYDDDLADDSVVEPHLTTTTTTTTTTTRQTQPQ